MLTQRPIWNFLGNRLVEAYVATVTDIDILDTRLLLAVTDKIEIEIEIFGNRYILSGPSVAA
jgi:hypothetical protein